MGGGPRPLRTTFFPAVRPTYGDFSGLFFLCGFFTECGGTRNAFPLKGCPGTACLGLPAIRLPDWAALCGNRFTAVGVRCIRLSSDSLGRNGDGMEASTQQEMDKLTHLFLPLTLATKSQTYHCIQHQIHFHWDFAPE